MFDIIGHLVLPDRSEDLVVELCPAVHGHDGRPHLTHIFADCWIYYVIIFFYHIVSVGDCGGGCGRGQGGEEPLAVLHPREAVVGLQ